MSFNLANSIKPKNIIFENKHMDGTNSFSFSERPKYKSLLNYLYSNNYKLSKETNEDTFVSLTIESYITNKTYIWENFYIKFLENCKIDAFGEGKYTILNEYNIIALFGGRKHHIVFSRDYTEFLSTRKGDLQRVNGKLVYFS